MNAPERPKLVARGTGPDRSPGNVTPPARPATDDKPLTGPEAAMVAAVRTAYSVANTQIERSAKLAQRLRGDQDRAAGGRAEPMDAASRTVLRATLAWLEWLETSNTDDSLAARISTILGADPRPVERPAAAAAAPAAAPPAAGTPYVQIVNKGPGERPVKVVYWDVQPLQRPAEVTFRWAEDLQHMLKGTLVHDTNADVRCSLTFDDVPLDLGAGVWRAGVFDDRKVQRGLVEIEL